jgi:hypothetical protein
LALDGVTLIPCIDLEGETKLMISAILSDPSLCVALLGSLFLFYWWLRHLRSGLRGFLLTVAGSAIVLLIVLLSQNKVPAFSGLAQMLSATLLPLVLACVALILVVLVLVGLLSRRRAAIGRASMRLPNVGEQKCPHCRQRGFLYRYEVGRGRHRELQLMCSDCAAQRDGKLSPL